MDDTRTVTVAVAGDQVVDWLLVSRSDADADVDIEWAWQTGTPFQLVSQPLGAEPLGELLADLLEGDPSRPVSVQRGAVPRRALKDPSFRGYLRTFTLWAPMGSPDRRQAPAWRIKRVIGRAEATAPVPLPPLTTDGPPDILVLEDLDVGFRDDPSRWEHLLGAGPQVLLRTTTPFGAGELWQRLVSTSSDRLTVVVDAVDLRRASLQVEQPLSWEHMYDHVVKAVGKSPLAAAGRVVVTLGLSGAVIVRSSGESCLVYDPILQESERERLGKGFVWGHQIVMLAALARQLVLAREDEVDAMHSGLHAMRTLHREGFEAEGEPGRERLKYPLRTVLDALREEPRGFCSVCLTEEQRSSSSILLETMSGGALDAAGRRAAREGPVGLCSVPMETVGAWSSVDRSEIESIRSLRSIMSEYVRAYVSGRRPGRPLSIAVFGPPGAGKSFAVKQVAAALLPGELRSLEFNLSQLSDASRLVPAFHALRDAILEGRLPLVFWDEFDSTLNGEQLGWLRHFLAPMQDGEFTEGDARHPLGPAIFVFAGGTSPTFRHFAESGDPVRDRQAKKSDFISRLRGYMDVLGPNPSGPDDVAFVLRRALLLQSLLRRSAPQVFSGGRLNIDDGLLHALLHVEVFRHGARSMEAIISMSALTGKASFERSSLPAPRQLGLHVDADDFLRLVEEERSD